MRKFLTIIFILLFSASLRADEGMWIPLLLEKYNISDMQDKGLKLSAEEIYSINHASLKDAVVIFGGGCTGEVISENGLVLTNHHCGYSYIQWHSSVEKDYLKNGYWAMNQEEELPTPGLNVTFLERIENVTKDILDGTEYELTEMARQEIIQNNIDKLTAPLKEGRHHDAVVKPFFYGNEYYMFVYKIYTDVRLVGAPPGSIGNYGKDYDNWMWPRHTGDFSVFRIYADENNQPSDYSPQNIPFKPKKYLSISLDGYESGDFTMVMGYPGSTNQYYTSDAVRMIIKKSYPKKIALREKRLKIMESFMSEDEKVRIQYASKYRRVSNAWKKWQGILLGLDKAYALEKKEQKEEEFRIWAENDPLRKERFGSVLDNLDNLYAEMSEYLLVYEYASEAFLATEMMEFILELNGFLVKNLSLDENDKLKAKEAFLSEVDKFFKDYYQPLDLNIYTSMLQSFYNDIDPKFHPLIYEQIFSKYNGDMNEFARKQFRKSKLTTKDDVYKLLSFYPHKEAKINKILSGDPLFKTFISFSNIYNEEVNARFNFIEGEIESAYRIYVRGLKQMLPANSLYPEANFTMRVAYGEVEGYSPRDAVIYNYGTTLSGVIEKYNTGFSDYSVPGKLIELYENKDFGIYADEKGKMNVCFIASNHTTGGNSGSPVLNSRGELIGLNFDRNWEGTMSDIYYDSNHCRNISVDIRYILFIIDKFAGAGYLLDEMNIKRP